MVDDEEIRDAYRAGLTVEEISGIYRVGTLKVAKLVEGISRPRRSGWAGQGSDGDVGSEGDAPPEPL